MSRNLVAAYQDRPSKDEVGLFKCECCSCLKYDDTNNSANKICVTLWFAIPFMIMMIIFNVMRILSLITDLITFIFSLF